jgi:hypothetical protein
MDAPTLPRCSQKARIRAWRQPEAERQTGHLPTGKPQIQRALRRLRAANGAAGYDIRRHINLLRANKNAAPRDGVHGKSDKV